MLKGTVVVLCAMCLVAARAQASCEFLNGAAQTDCYRTQLENARQAQQELNDLAEQRRRIESYAPVDSSGNPHFDNVDRGLLELNNFNESLARQRLNGALH